MHWDLFKSFESSLKFCGITKDPKTNELMMIMESMSTKNLKNLRYVLSNDFNRFFWKYKIKLLYFLSRMLKKLHKLGYSHTIVHSANILFKNDSYEYYYFDGYN